MNPQTDKELLEAVKDTIEHNGRLDMSIQIQLIRRFECVLGDLYQTEQLLEKANDRHN